MSTPCPWSVFLPPTTQGELAQLGTGVERVVRDVVGGHVLEVLLARSDGHRCEFLRLVNGILSINDCKQ